MSMNLRALASALGALVSIVAAAQPAAAQEKVIKIGALLPMSWPGSYFGAQDRQGVDLRSEGGAGPGHLQPVDDVAPVDHVRVGDRPRGGGVAETGWKVVGQDRDLLGLGDEDQIPGMQSPGDRAGHGRHVALGVPGVGVRVRR